MNAEFSLLIKYTYNTQKGSSNEQGKMNSKKVGKLYFMMAVRRKNSTRRTLSAPSGIPPLHPSLRPVKTKLFNIILFHFRPKHRPHNNPSAQPSTRPPNIIMHPFTLQSASPSIGTTKISIKITIQITFLYIIHPIHAHLNHTRVLLSSLISFFPFFFLFFFLLIFPSICVE